MTDDDKTIPEMADEIIEAANEFLDAPNDVKAEAEIPERVVLAFRNIAVAIKQQMRERDGDGNT